MTKPHFKAVLHGDDNQHLHIEMSAFGKGARLEVRQYVDALPTLNGFNAPISLLERAITELQGARAKAIEMGLLKRK